MTNRQERILAVRVDTCNINIHITMHKRAAGQASRSSTVVLHKASFAAERLLQSTKWAYRSVHNLEIDLGVAIETKVSHVDLHSGEVSHSFDEKLLRLGGANDACSICLDEEANRLAKVGGH